MICCNSSQKSCMQVAQEEGHEVSSNLFVPFFFKVPWFCKKCSNFGKMCPGCMHEWFNFHLKCSFKSILDKNHHKFFLLGLFFCAVRKMFIKMLLLQEISPALENSWLRTWRYLREEVISLYLGPQETSKRLF